MNTVMQANVIECPKCDGAQTGCEYCGETGVITVEGCPNKHVRDLHDLIFLMDQFHNFGNMPIEGGVLNQSDWFLHASKFFKAEEDRAKAE